MPGGQRLADSGGTSPPSRRALPPRKFLVLGVFWWVFKGFQGVLELRRPEKFVWLA